MKKIAFILSAVMMSGVAFAQDTEKSFAKDVFKDTGVSLKAGLNGVGFDVTKSVNEYIKVRAGYSQVKVNKDYDQDDVTYDGKLKIGGWDLLVDYHPWAGGMRVTGGVYGPQTKFDAKAKYTGAGTVTINDTVYNMSEVKDLNANVKWSGVKPYLGLGYDGFNSQKTGGLFFTADAGVIFAGAPSLSLNANCVTANSAVCTQLDSDIQAQKARFKDDIKDAKWLPVIQVGVGYRF